MDLVCHVIDLQVKAVLFFHDLAVQGFLGDAIVHGFAKSELEEVGAVAGVLEHVAASDESRAPLAVGACDGKKNVVEKCIVHIGPDPVVAAGGASVDAVAARLADAGTAFAFVEDGVVEDFGQARGTHDALGDGGVGHGVAGSAKSGRVVKKKQERNGNCVCHERVAVVANAECDGFHTCFFLVLHNKVMTVSSASWLL